MKKLFKLLFGATVLIMISGCGGRREVPAGYTVSEDTTSKDTIAEDTASKDTATDDTVTEDTASQEAASEEEITGDAASGFAAFSVYDLDQKEKSLGSLISSNKITMLNFWGTFCGPCIAEMPHLAGIEREYKDKGFEIVGITVDAMDYGSGRINPDIIKDARSIMDDTGVDYPVVIANLDIIEYTQLNAVPTTYFVDASGNALGEPYYGAKSAAEWKSIIDDLLSRTD